MSAPTPGRARWTCAAAAAAIADAGAGPAGCLTVRARRGTLTALSRLARLDAARATSPVPASRLWDAEAADLVRRAGLPVDRAATGSGPGRGVLRGQPFRFRDLDGLRIVRADVEA